MEPILFRQQKLFNKIKYMSNTENNVFNINGLSINKPSKNKDGWYTIQQQSFSIDKGSFLVNEFNKDFPNFKCNDIEQLNDIVSRSTALKEWFRSASLKFVDSIQLPVSLKDKIEPSEYQTYFEDMQSIKDNLAKKSAEIEKASVKFNNELKSITNEYENVIKNIKSKNKIYSILTLTKEDLPLTLQFEINGYSPKVDDVVKERSSYGSELLVEYQRVLIDKLNEDPDVDINQLINENRLK
jgi:hypothetical protein